MGKAIRLFLIAMLLIICQFGQAYGEPVNNSNQKAEEYVQIGNEMFREGNLQEALKAYREAENLNPQNMLAFYNEGMVLKELNRNSEAITAFKSALKINGNSISISYEIGDTYEKMGNKDEAMSWYNKAVELVPKSATGYYYHANALKKLGRFNEAQQDYNKAAELDPKYSKYASGDKTPATDQSQQTSNKSVIGSIKDFLEYGSQNNMQPKLIFAILIIVFTNVILVLKNKRRQEKESITDSKVREYVQKQLGVYTFTKEDSSIEGGQWYGRTRDLLKSWSKVKLENAIERLQKDFAYDTCECLADINLLLEEELKTRETVCDIEENIFDDLEN